MTSKKQIAANRRNAKKSTGPRSEEGKAKSSLNALKHGLTSQRVWLDEEEEKDFREFRQGLLDELMPLGSLERLARHEAILERSLIRLLNEYRRIQTDRLRRENRYAEDLPRAGLPPDFSIYNDDDGGLPPVYLAETEHKGTEEIIEKAATATTRPSQAAVRRNPRKRHVGKKTNRGKKPHPGGNALNGTPASGGGPLAHTGGPESPLSP